MTYKNLINMTEIIFLLFRLIGKLTKCCRISAIIARQVVDNFVAEIISVLQNNKIVISRQFGTFLYKTWLSY